MMRRQKESKPAFKQYFRGKGKGLGISGGDESASGWVGKRRPGEGRLSRVRASHDRARVCARQRIDHALHGYPPSLGDVDHETSVGIAIEVVGIVGVLPTCEHT